MASPAPSRPTPREPDRRRCRRPPTTPQPQVAHPPGEPPDSSFLSPSRWFAPIRCHRAIIQLPDLGLMVPRRGSAVILEALEGGLARPRPRSACLKEGISRIRQLSSTASSLQREEGGALADTLYRAIVDTADDAIIV